ncbi:hypothetical protein M0R04_09510 [Candidatus Dojkabacteria bacterium]|jgi:hypothetical protein|nr:hypothetical protein [Candidatus Dojkabacteria bacterium]
MNLVQAPIKEAMYPAPGVMANAWIKFFLNNYTDLGEVTKNTYINQVATTVNSTTTLTTDTFITICDSASNIILNLPQASTMQNKFFVIYNKGIGDCLVSPYGTETIQGDARFSLRQWESIPVLSDGSNWFIF